MNKKPKILVVGSFVMDQIAETETMPDEGQTVLGLNFRKAPGGKGANQAVQCARLGADVTMVGKLGTDSNGDELLDTCASEGIDISHVRRTDISPSGCSVLILEKHCGQTQNRIIVVPGTNMDITLDDVRFLEDDIKNYDLVMLQLEIPMEINEYVATLARKNNIPVMLNPAPSAELTDDFLSCIKYISPNESEAQALTGIALNHEQLDENAESIWEAADLLHVKGISETIITLGSVGAAVHSENSNVFGKSIQGITSVDPTAAGDSFVAAYCVGSCLNWTIKDKLTFSNCTAAITVSRNGAIPSLPKLADVIDFMRSKSIECPDISLIL